MSRPAETEADGHLLALICLGCGRRLSSDGPGACRSCGRTYDPANPASYRTAPAFLGWPFWAPAFFLAMLCGVASYAVVLTTGTELGAALFVSVPASFGAILGYATRVRLWVALALGLVLIPGVIISLVTLDLTGVFCGVTLGAIFFGPVMLGIVAGWLLRICLRATRWSQRQYLPVIFFAVAPMLAEVFEARLPRQTAVATVRTELTMDATPQEAWEGLKFYEEVRHDPPWLARWLLPRPIRAEGPKAAVGDRVRCVYDEGYVVKQITRYEPGRRLAFRVVEQTLFPDELTLRDGSFELLPIAGGRTQVVLTTRYARRLSPTAEWGPIERAVLHSLHGHVLEGMRRQAEGEPPYVPPRDDADPAPPLTRGGHTAELARTTDPP
jgi:hypothetical protein